MNKYCRSERKRRMQKKKVKVFSASWLLWVRIKIGKKTGKGKGKGKRK